MYECPQCGTKTSGIPGENGTMICPVCSQVLSKDNSNCIDCKIATSGTILENGDRVCPICKKPIARPVSQ